MAGSARLPPPPWPEDQSDLRHWTSLIREHSRNGDCDRALGVLPQMRHTGVSPSRTTYAAAMGACYRAKEWQRALELLAEMPAHGLKPDATTRGTAVGTCAQSQAWEMALQLVDEMHADRLELDVAACCASLCACETGGRWRESLLLLEELRRAASPPLREQRPSIATSVGNAFGSVVRATAAGDYVVDDELLTAEDSLHADSCPASPSSPSVPAVGAEVDVADSPSRPAKTSTENRRGNYANFIQGCSAAARTCAAAHAWPRALELLTELNGEDPALMSAVYKAVLKECEATHQWEQALQFLSTVPRRGMPLELLMHVKQVERTTGRIRLASQDEQRRSLNDGVCIYPELSEAYKERLRKIFNRLDTDGDGTLSKSELVRLCRGDPDVAKFFIATVIHYVEYSERDAIDECFQGIDTNNDRQISWEEFEFWFRANQVEQQFKNEINQVEPSGLDSAAEAEQEAQNVDRQSIDLEVMSDLIHTPEEAPDGDATRPAAEEQDESDSDVDDAPWEPPLKFGDCSPASQRQARAGRRKWSVVQLPPECTSE